MKKAKNDNATGNFYNILNDEKLRQEFSGETEEDLLTDDELDIKAGAKGFLDTFDDSRRTPSGLSRDEDLYPENTTPSNFDMLKNMFDSTPDASEPETEKQP